MLIQERLLIIRTIKALSEACRELTIAAGPRIRPDDIAQRTWRINMQRCHWRLSQDAAMPLERWVEVVLATHTDRHDKLHIVITLAKFQITLANRCAVWRDENLNEVAIELVAQMVGLFLIKGNDEISQTIHRALKGTLWLKEAHCRWYIPTKDGRGVLVELVEQKRQPQCCTQLIYRGVGVDRHQNIITLT